MSISRLWFPWKASIAWGHRLATVSPSMCQPATPTTPTSLLPGPDFWDRSKTPIFASLFSLPTKGTGINQNSLFVAQKFWHWLSSICNNSPHYLLENYYLQLGQLDNCFRTLFPKILRALLYSFRSYFPSRGEIRAEKTHKKDAEFRADTFLDNTGQDGQPIFQSCTSSTLKTHKRSNAVADLYDIPHLSTSSSHVSN